MRFFPAFFALLVAGCAAPNISGVSSPITALLTTASDAATLDQELADEFAKQSAQLYFLSDKKATCLDNDGLTPAYTKTKDIERQELALLKLRLADLYNLSGYAETLASFDKERLQRAQQIDTTLALIGAGVQIAGYNPAFKLEADAVKDAAASIAALAKLVDTYKTAYEVINKAREMQKKVDAMIGRLEDKFHIVGDRAQLYVNAWRACTREKYIYIRDRMATPSKPLSVVDLDNNYGAFRAQYRAYLNRIPHIDKAAFEKVRTANNAMLNAQSPDDFAKAAQNLAAVVGQLVSTYKSVKDDVKVLYGT